jgi:hypothetical protein
LDEAVSASPNDGAAVARRIRALRSAGYWREALSVTLTVPSALREHPGVRTEIGNFYRECECSALAARAYGPSATLTRSARISRWACWLRSGGPSARLRRQSEEWERRCLEELQYPGNHIESLSRIEGLDTRLATWAQAQLENREYRYIRRWLGSGAVQRAGHRLIPLVAVPIWLVMIVIVSVAGFRSQRGGRDDPCYSCSAHHASAVR